MREPPARPALAPPDLRTKLTAETNRQLYTLSVLTAAFGMNLEGIPFTQAPWGFWGAVGLSILSSGAVMLYLRLTDRN